MTTPQIVMLIMILWETVITFIRSFGKYPLPVSITGSIIRGGVVYGVLYWGGFWG